MLVGQRGLGVGLLRLDGARRAGHEGLGVVRQALDHAHQVAQRGVHLGGARAVLCGQGLQGFEPVRGVLERHGLQLG